MSEWITSNAHLTLAQMENNARIIIPFFRRHGWTDNAIAATLANMEAESTINPGRWQSGIVGKAFGLVQWDSYTKLWNWIDATYGDGDYSNGDYQLERIIWELENGGQWVRRDVSRYPQTFREFTISSESAYTLAGCFCWNYEGTNVVINGTEAEKEALRQYRGGLGEKWYAFVTGAAPPQTLKIPVWLLFKFNLRRF